MQLQRSCKERALYQTGGGGDQILTDFLKYLQKVDSFSCNFMTAFPNVQKRRCEGLSCNPLFYYVVTFIASILEGSIKADVWLLVECGLLSGFISLVIHVSK